MILYPDDIMENREIQEKERVDSMNRMAKAAAFGLILSLFGSFCSWAQENPLFSIFPQIRDMPAPSWLREGMRLTYYSSAASIPEGRHLYFEDETGTWVDGQGNRYRQEETTGTGGHGFTQVDVTAIERNSVALSIRSLGMTGSGTQGSLSLLGFDAYTGPSGAGADWWISPQFLATIEERNEQGLRILRMPYRLGHSTYRAIRFQAENQQGRHIWVYDLDSGILLHGGGAVSGRISGAFSQELHPGTSDMLSQSTLVNVRQITLPWMRSAPPFWPASLRSLRYEGTTTVYVPGSPAFPLPVALVAQVVGGGERWLQFRATDVLPSAPGLPPSERYSSRISGIAQATGFWLPPNGIGALRAGEQLDADPVTGISTSVGFCGTGQDGHPMVVITESCSGYSLECAYNAQNGLLSGFRLQDGTLNQVTEMRLVEAR